jgi:hypothetical protein
MNVFAMACFDYMTGDSEPRRVNKTARKIYAPLRNKECCGRTIWPCIVHGDTIVAAEVTCEACEQTLIDNEVDWSRQLTDDEMQLCRCTLESMEARFAKFARDNQILEPDDDYSDMPPLIEGV